MDGLYWKTLILMDDLGVPLFLETPLWEKKHGDPLEFQAPKKDQV